MQCIYIEYLHQYGKIFIAFDAQCVFQISNGVTPSEQAFVGLQNWPGRLDTWRRGHMKEVRAKWQGEANGRSDPASGQCPLLEGNDLLFLLPRKADSQPVLDLSEAQTILGPCKPHLTKALATPNRIRLL